MWLNSPVGPRDGLSSTSTVVLQRRTDRELLEAYVFGGKQRAFTVLMRRHAGLVWSICRRLVPNGTDAEDAFQATFLVLARKASTIRWEDSIADWLYQVAHRVSWKARSEAYRRRNREHHAAAERAAETTGPTSPGDEARQLLHEELRHLPKCWRLPLLLCYLEGKTRDEAAQELGWSLGKVKARLERGRAALRVRLAERGYLFSVALVATLLTQSEGAAALPRHLAKELARQLFPKGNLSLVQPISQRVLLLAQEPVRSAASLPLSKLAACFLGTVLLSLGPGLAITQSIQGGREDSPAPVVRTPVAVTAPVEAPRPHWRLEPRGDSSAEGHLSKERPGSRVDAPGKVHTDAGQH